MHKNGWTQEKIKEAKELMKTYSAKTTGEKLSTAERKITKNAVLGVLYRQKIKEGYTPPADSPFAIKKPNYPRRRLKICPECKGIGYIKLSFEGEENIKSCDVCKSSGEVY